jgi:NTP pyrophosphatase (non-canonical NTP hydrolase)
VDELRRAIRKFARERDWDRYHSPKNLAVGLSVEAGELLELFLWRTDDDSKKLSEPELQQLRHEIGDVLIYLINLADKFDLDPIECAGEKLDVNRAKYPADKVRGSAKKYTEYE